MYGSQACALSRWPDCNWHLGLWTRRASTAYFHVCRWPGVELTLPRGAVVKVGLHDKVKAGETVIAEVQP